ncbi:MAG: hypothetical protein QXF35_01325 [Candidatus Bilamarchaeaceae archaeon]
MAAQLPGIWEGAWLPYSIAAIFIALLIQGLIYAIAKAFNLTELERGTKSEIMQVLATFFLAVFLVIIVGSLSDYVNSQIYGTIMCGGKEVTVENTASALYVMQCKVIEKARALESIHLAIREEANDAYYTFYSSFNVMGVPVFSGQYISGLYKTIENYRYKNNLTTTLLIALNALITFIAYIGASMLTFFLPLGVLLRAFYFTRGIGSLFISLAIGFYFIFPYVFIITDPGFVKLPPPEKPSPTLSNEFCYQTFSSVISIVNYNTKQGEWKQPAGSDYFTTNDLAKIYASLILHPLASLFLTIIFVRYLMYLFGEESYDLLRMTARLV